MTGIPDDATRTGIWAEVPCDKCNGTGCDELTVADYEVAGIDIDLDDDDLGTPEYADDCFDCNGTGTRVVVTDVEVERVTRPVAVSSLPGGFEVSVPVAPDSPLWQEVQP